MSQWIVVLFLGNSVRVSHVFAATLEEAKDEAQGADEWAQVICVYRVEGRITLVESGDSQ